MNGIITYKEVKYLYVIKDFKLILNTVKLTGSDIPYNDFINFINNAVSQSAEDNIPEILTGFDFTNNKKVKFFLTSMFQTKIDQYECSFSSYLLYTEDIHEFNRLQVENSILTHFHLYTHGDTIKNSFDLDSNTQKTKLKNTPDKFQFQIDNKDINAEINSVFNYHIAKLQNFSVKTFINFYFATSKEISLIDDLLFNINEFLNFITNKNTYKILSTDIYNGGKKIGTYILNVPYDDNHIYEDKVKTIPFDYIKDSLGALFNTLANTKIYTSHIKESEFDSGKLTYSRIIMLAAGFEWQFNYLDYPIAEDIKKKITYKDNLDGYIVEMISKTTGDEKKYLKNIKKLLHYDLESLSLARKIRYALELHEEILFPFISNLWNLNNLQYPSMYELSESIANTRNIIAHGNLSKDIPETTVLDYKILQYLYYAMILNSLSIPLLDIQKSIKYLFKVNISLE